MRATALDVSPICERNRPGLVVRRERCVGFRVGVDERHEWPTVGTALAHIDLVIPQQNLAVYNLSAVGTNAAREFMEYVLDIFPRTSSCRVADFTCVKRHGVPGNRYVGHLSSHTVHSRTGDSNVVRRQ